MPMYTMKCTECGNQFEHLTKSITNPSKAICSECNSENCERIYDSTPAVIYKKGSGGFYSKDYEDPKEKMKYLASD